MSFKQELLDVVYDSGLDYVKCKLLEAAKNELGELKIPFSRTEAFNEKNFGTNGKFTEKLKQWATKEEIKLEAVNEYHGGYITRIIGWKFTWNEMSKVY